jgi:phenylpyruvate tautomerase PptA (4-oxalocrotonate tautomerase family)
MVRYERFMIWEKVLDWSSPFDTNNDRFLKISLLRFYPGATPEKKGNKLKMTMKNRKRNRSIVNIMTNFNVRINFLWIMSKSSSLISTVSCTDSMISVLSVKNNSIHVMLRKKNKTNWKWRWKTEKETGVWKKSSWQEIFLKMTNRATLGLVSF